MPSSWYREIVHAIGWKQQRKGEHLINSHGTVGKCEWTQQDKLTLVNVYAQFQTINDKKSKREGQFAIRKFN